MRYGHVGAGNEQETRGDVAAIGDFDLPVSVYQTLLGASKKESNVDEGLRYVHTITYAPFIPQVNRVGMCGYLPNRNDIYKSGRHCDLRQQRKIGEKTNQNHQMEKSEMNVAIIFGISNG